MNFAGCPWPSLVAADVHVWLAFDPGLREPALLRSFEGMLANDERERQQRLHLAEDRHQFLITRGLQRGILSLYEPRVAPPAWSFERSARGRPAIGRAHGVPRLDFNIAHTPGLVAMAISRHVGVGVDVENCARRAPLDVARRYFPASEVAELEALDAPARARRFFELWTLKEAWAKAADAGVAAGMRRTLAGDVQSVLFAPGPDHLLALAHRALDLRAARIEFRELSGAGEVRAVAPAPL